ncbi:hypothetical protein [Lentzea sp. NPDC059081]|uniref:hypothetical protein n=1 Tax=Lentzea sp. NPDC059081 TaxID=3346719 RepID=UPI0036C69F37
MTGSEVSNTAHNVGDGTVVQVGTLNGDINLLTGAPVRTRYREQVMRIAPPALEDRAAELAELTEFCTSAETAGGYAWWRAEAWSGKSALMSTFVLTPPPGVRIVSFFVTARLAGQNDRAAFIDNLMEQLLALLGETLPPFLTDATREGHALGLLGDAARACRARGEQFVLLVDGLDEDRGVDSYSIAALLPAEPPAGMRVVVAGRPNPPIPGDVPEHHPLLDPGIVRELTASPRAKAIRNEMERDLARLLGGSQFEQDLLGLTTAAGGGLTAADLADLTGETPWQVNRNMQTVTGRSFTRRDSHYLPGQAPDVYLLGHEEIQVTALEMLGPTRLASYRDRLHTWASRHRANGWRGSVPEYLLRGYFGMLAATGDVERMIECATDGIRHDRMLALSGSDATALAETAATLDVLGTREQPDLVAMLRVAVHRDRLSERGGDIPLSLPVAWAELGRTNRAETVAASIDDPGRRAQAFIQLVQVVHRDGDPGRAMELFDRAQEDAIATADPHLRIMVLTRLIECAMWCGRPDRGATLLDLVPSPAVQYHASTTTQIALVQAAFHCCGAERALQIVSDMISRTARVKALTSLALLARERYEDLLDRAEAIASQIGPQRERKAALVIVARTAATLGDEIRAQRLNEMLDDQRVKAEIGLALVQSAASAGDLGEAVRLVEDITDAGVRVRAWLKIAKFTGSGTTADILDQVRGASRFEPEMSLVEAAADTGEFDLAEELAVHLSSRNRAEAQVVIVRAAAQAGDTDRAVRIARAMTDSIPVLHAWTAAAGVAPDLLDEAAAAISAAQPSAENVTAWVALARTAAKTGNATAATLCLERGEAVLRRLVLTTHDMAERVALATAAALAGDLVRSHAILASLPGGSEAVWPVAEKLAGQDAHAAESFARMFGQPDREVWLTRLAKLLLGRAELAEAERIAELVHQDRPQDTLLIAIATAAARAGDTAHALAIWGRHLEWNDVEALDDLIGQLASAGVLHGMTKQVTDEHVRTSIRTAISNEEFRQRYRRTYGRLLSKRVPAPWRVDDSGNSRWMIKQQREQAARFMALHRADDISAMNDVLTELLNWIWLPQHLLEPVVQVLLDRNDLDRAESASLCPDPYEPRENVLTMVVTAAAAAGDDERVDRVHRAIQNERDHAAISLLVAEMNAHRGRYDRVERVLNELPSLAFLDEGRRRTATAAAQRGDYDRATAFVSAISDRTLRLAAEKSVLDIALTAGDIRAAARMVPSRTDPTDRLRAAVAVARCTDEPQVITQMVDLAGDPEGQASVWLAVTGALRRRAIANAIRLARWHLVVEAVVEAEQTAFELVMAELEALRG